MWAIRVFLILAVMPAWAQAQLICADLDGASVFSSGNTPVYLGFLGNEFASHSINNRSGTYGSENSSSSVRNRFGTYGNTSSMYSAQNQFASRPPKLIRGGRFIAYLSTNQAISFTAVSLTALDDSCNFSSSSPAPFYTTSTAAPPPPPDASPEATYSGLWFNPAQDGHGLSISVHSPESVSVFWYTYNPFGTPIWIIAPGRFVGSKIVADVLYFQGMKFGDWNPADQDVLEWGTLEISFTACDQATLTYSSDLEYPSGERFGEGEIALVRLASIAGLDCK